MSDFKIVGKNPFANVNRLVIEATEITDGKRLSDHDGIYLPVTNKVEYRTHLHVFTRTKDYKATIDRLSSAGKGLYLYIQSRLEPSLDYITINKEYYMLSNNVGSINTVRKAINNLIDNDIIIKMGTYSDTFWINPVFLFCGSRINKFPNNVIVKSEITKD